MTNTKIDCYLKYHFWEKIGNECHFYTSTDTKEPSKEFLDSLPMYQNYKCAICGAFKMELVPEKEIK